MIFNVAVRTWVIGGWIVATALVLAIGMSIGATLSTMMLLAALGVAPGLVIVLLLRSASPSVAEILQAVATKGSGTRRADELRQQ